MVNGTLHFKINQIHMNKPLLFLFYLLSVVNPQTVSFTVENPTLETIISKIESQTDYKFAYGDDIDLKKELTGTFSFKETALENVLRDLSKRTPYTLSLIGNNITISWDIGFRSTPRTGQYPDDQLAVRGTVLDGEGLPLAGANILEKGTANGTQTDFDGNFMITIGSRDAVLVVSYLGFVTQEIPVQGQSSLNIALSEDAAQLSEVVVTALGIERNPRELSYSVSALDNDDITQTESVNVATAMVGKVAGMQINTINNGVNPETRVVLRGNRSLLGNNEALIVVDGFPSSRNVLDQINPNDIEEMTVLKGANASALYGSEAANGVLVIKTKKGSGKLNVSYTSTFQLESVSYLPEFQDEFGSGGFVGTFGPLENVNWGPHYDGRLATASETYPDGSVWMLPYSPIKDNHRDFFNTGGTLRNGITLSGGDDNGDFLLSLDHSNVKGVMPRDAYNRTNVRFKGSRKYGNLEVGGNLSFFRSHANVVGARSRPVYWHIINTPLWIPLSEMKNWRTGEFTRNEVSFYRFYTNPYFNIDTQREKTDIFQFNLLTNVNYRFNDWINASLNLGYTGRNRKWKEDIGALTYAFRVPNAYHNIEDYGASTSDISDSSTRFNGDFILNFDKEITDDFGANLTLGHNVRIQTTNSINVGGNNLIIPDFYNVSTRTGNLEGGQETTEYRKWGVYGELTLSYRKFLFLSATARNDWSSALPENNRSFFYPGAGISFVASDAFPGIKGDHGISYLKANFNITKTGNDPEVYAVQGAFYAPSDFPYGSTVGLTQADREPDPNLNPEFTTSYEAGIEFGLFRNRLSGGVTLYQTNSTDQIIPINVSLSSGASSNLINIGEIENQGMEIDLKGTLLRADGFSWDLGVNYSGFRSEVLSLAEGVDELDIGGSANAQIIAKVGEPFPLIRTTAYERDDLGRVIVGDNGDPLKSNSNKVQGKTSPDYIVGLNSRIEYKNFSLYGVMDYRTGHVFYNDIVNAMEFTGLTQHSASANRQPFLFPNSSYSDGNGGYVANTDRPTSTGGYYFWNSAYNQVKENYVTDATTLKLRELALTYNFAKAVLDKIKLQQLSLGLFGRNLVTWRPKANVYTDPEFNSSSGNAVGVGSQSQGPPTRQYGITLTAQF